MSDSFIDEAFLKNLEKLKIIAQKGIKGPERGEHKSWRSGEGLEFLDYRKYQVGDDLRYVDWSVYGRLDKLFIKLFHAEENQTVHILIDVSRSMAAGDPPKMVSAQKFAAAVGYIGLANQDKITLTAFAEQLAVTSPVFKGKRKYARLLRYLLTLAASAQTNINACLSEYAALCKNPGMAVVISDLFDPQGYAEGLKALAYRNFDVSLIQVLDHEELSWSKTGALMLRDVETGEKKATFLDQALLGQYRQKVAAFLATVQSFCSNYGINYAVYDTSIPFEEFLIEYITQGAIFR